MLFATRIAVLTRIWTRLWHAHAWTLVLESDRLHLACDSCPATSPGWDLPTRLPNGGKAMASTAPPAVTAAAERARRAAILADTVVTLLSADGVIAQRYWGDIHAAVIAAVRVLETRP